jgi:hypothetical protein
MPTLSGSRESAFFVIGGNVINLEWSFEHHDEL